MAIFQHKDVLIPTINFDLGDPTNCVWPLENSTGIDDISGFKLALREVIHDINTFTPTPQEANHIHKDLLDNVFKFFTINNSSGAIQYDTDFLPLLKPTLDTAGTYNINRISTGFLSEASTLVALYYLTKKLSILNGHFSQTDLNPSSNTDRPILSILPSSTNISKRKTTLLDWLNNSNEITDADLPPVAKHLMLILKANGFNFNFDSLTVDDKVDLISLLDPIFSIGTTMERNDYVYQNVPVYGAESINGAIFNNGLQNNGGNGNTAYFFLKHRIYYLAKNWMSDSKKLANFGLSSSTNATNRYNRLANVVDSVLRGYGEVIFNHNLFWTQSLFHSILSNKNYPLYSNALATGDGTGTKGLLNYLNLGILLFTYSYKNDKKGTVNDVLSIGDKDKLTIEKNTSIHLAIFGLDQPTTPLPPSLDYDPYQTSTSTPSVQLNSWTGNSVVTIINKSNGDKFEFIGNRPNGLFHYYYKKGSLESANNHGIYTELISTVIGANTFYTVQYYDRNNHLIAEYQSEQKSLRFYYENYLNQPFDVSVSVASANEAGGDYSSMKNGGNAEELQLLLSVVEDDPIINIYLSEENLYPNDKFEVPIKKANTFFTNPSSYELGLELLIDLLPPNTTTPSESTVINPPILNGHFIGTQINDISENENNLQILVQADQRYRYITSPLNSTTPPKEDNSEDATESLFYSHLRYSHAHIAIMPPQYPTFPYHRINININSFVSPLRSRLDTRFQHDYRASGTPVPSPLLNDTTPDINILDSSYTLPLSQYKLEITTGNFIHSYNQPLAMFRSMGMLEGIYNRILNHPQSAPNYNDIRTILKSSINSAIAIDKSAIDRSLSSHIPPTSTDYNINNIDYATFKTFKWYWLYHKDENSAIGDFLVNSVLSTPDLKAEFELSSLPADQISENDYVFVSGFVNNTAYNGVKKVLSVNTSTNKIKLDIVFGTNESNASTKVFYYDRIQFYSEDFT